MRFRLVDIRRNSKQQKKWNSDISESYLISCEAFLKDNQWLSESKTKNDIC